MKITIDTKLNVIVVPASFQNDINKQNEALKNAGVPEDKYVSARKIILDAVEDALKRPILNPKQYKEYDPDLENQMAK